MRGRKSDIIIQPGNQIGSWTVIQEGPRSTSNLRTWECMCACGNRRIVHDQNLKRAGTSHGSTNCGCLRKQKLSKLKTATTHGESYSLEYAMLHSAKSRAKKAGLPFDLELKDIVIPDTCPLLGTKLEVSHGKPSWNSPSLDKLVPSKGYVKGNVWVISRKANTLKGDASLEDLQKLVSNLEKRFTEIDRT